MLRLLGTKIRNLQQNVRRVSGGVRPRIDPWATGKHWLKPFLCHRTQFIERKRITRRLIAGDQPLCN